MLGLVPGIHVFLAETPLNVDGRNKSGHDEEPIVIDLNDLISSRSR